MASEEKIIVLTDAKPAEMPERFVSDRGHFPLEPIFTTDLAKARHWKFTPGLRRFLKNHKGEFGVVRRVYIPISQYNAAVGQDRKAAPLPAGGSGSANTPARSRGSIHGRRSTIRTTKLDPNKRAKAARRKRAFRSLRKTLAKPKLRRASKSLKAA